MIYCDICAQERECLRKKIDEKEYDICQPCWRRLAEKLRAKGRIAQEQEEVEEYVETAV